MKKSIILAVLMACVVPASLALGEEGVPAPTTQKSEILISQTYLKTLVGELLQDMDKVAAALDAKDPDSAHAIRDAIKTANDAAILNDIDGVVKALMDDKLAKALGQQEGVNKSLKEILEVLRRGGAKSDAEKHAAELQKQLEDVNAILDKQKKVEEETRIAAAKDLQRQMDELMQQIGDIVKEQKQVMADSDKANPDEQVKKLADVLNEIRRLIAAQDAVRSATANSPIDRLPFVAKMQKDLGEKANQIAKELADAAKDDKVAKMLKDTGGDAGAPAEAAKDVGLANGEMQKASDALSKSTPKDASVSQVQAGEDLKNAEKALAAAVAKAASTTDSGKLAVKQSGLEDKTIALSKTADDLTKKIGLEDEKPQPADNKQPGDSKPGDAKPGDAKPGDAKPGDAKPGDAKPGDAKPGDAKPGDAKPGDAKPGDAKPGESKPGESKPGEPKKDDQPKGNNLQKAAEHMNAASEQLNGQQPKPATAEQQKAIEQLEQKKLQLAQLKGKVMKLAEKPLSEQEKEQKDLSEQSAELSDKMAKQGDDQPGQKKTASASQSQSDASKKLGEQNPDGANKKQKKAIEELELAKAELEDALDEAKKQAQADKLAKLDSMLSAILSRQQDDSKATKDTFQKSGGKDVYERAEELKLTEVAKDEGALKDQTGDVLALIAKDGDSTVFTPMLKTVQGDLGDVQKFLGQKSAGVLTQKIQSDVEHRLQDMIDAINKQRADVIHRPKKPADGSGKGGKGAGKKEPLVPPLAELKLLLSMQIDVNERTLVLDQNTDSKLTKETLDNQKKMLGEQQGKVSDMMKKAAGKLKEPGGGEGGPSSDSF